MGNLLRQLYTGVNQCAAGLSTQHQDCCLVGFDAA